MDKLELGMDQRVISEWIFKYRGLYCLVIGCCEHGDETLFP